MLKCTLEPTLGKLGDFKDKLWGVASVFQHENTLSSGRGRNLRNGYSSWLKKSLSSWWDHWGHRGSTMAEDERQRAIAIDHSGSKRNQSLLLFLFRTEMSFTMLGAPSEGNTFRDLCRDLQGSLYLLHMGYLTTVKYLVRFYGNTSWLCIRRNLCLPADDPDLRCSPV